MKKITVFIAAALMAMPSIPAFSQKSDPVGTLAYALPQTTLVLEVEAERQSFYAGPYARFSQKYLGFEAKTEDAVTFQLLSVKMTPYLEADPSARFVVTPGTSGAPSFLQLTAQGLVSVADGSFGQSSQWRFPKQTSGDFSDRGVSANLTSESTTLYRSVRTESAFDKIAIQQDMVVEKSLERKAQEAAEKILEIREKKYQIVTGDTDATYSGEAMPAAIAELSRLEDEYMSLFVGYSESQVQKMKFDVVPSASAKSQVYVAFRLSDTAGLVSSDDMSGKPYLLELTPQEVERPKNQAAPSKSTQLAYYRIPATCGVKLSDGVNIILQDRVTVYQLGTTSTFPLSAK